MGRSGRGMPIGERFERLDRETRRVDERNRQGANRFPALFDVVDVQYRAGPDRASVLEAEAREDSVLQSGVNITAKLITSQY